jgi:nucleotide-binding universal stress UspA family protein
MKILLYAGAAPWRDLVLQFSTQIVHHAASALTLIATNEREADALLHDAAERLQVPAHLPVEQLTMPGDAQQAILAAAQQAAYDLVIFGRLNRPLKRLLPGPRSKTIAQRLAPSVLRVHGSVGPIRRILLASGGNYHTLTNARALVPLAAALNAEVTVLHVLSQEQICFELIPDTPTAQEDFPHSDRPEATVLRETVDLLHQQGVNARLRIRIGLVVNEVLAELAPGGYDLLVIGRHRAGSTLDRMLLENISSTLLDSSPLPVLLVKEQDTFSQALPHQAAT